MIELQELPPTEEDSHWDILQISRPRIRFHKVIKPDALIGDTVVLFQGLERKVIGVFNHRSNPEALMVEFKRLSSERQPKRRHPVDTRLALETIARLMICDTSQKATPIPTKVWASKVHSLMCKGYIKATQTSRVAFNIDWLTVKGLTMLDPDLAMKAHTAAFQMHAKSNGGLVLGMPVWPPKPWMPPPPPREPLVPRQLTDSEKEIARHFYAAGVMATDERMCGENMDMRDADDRAEFVDKFDNTVIEYLVGEDITEGLNLTELTNLNNEGEPNVES